MHHYRFQVINLVHVVWYVSVEKDYNKHRVGSLYKSVENSKKLT